MVKVLLVINYFIEYKIILFSLLGSWWPIIKRFRFHSSISIVWKVIIVQLFHYLSDLIVTKQTTANPRSELKIKQLEAKKKAMCCVSWRCQIVIVDSMD